jgi:hypothetical protein
MDLDTCISRYLAKNCGKAKTNSNLGRREYHLHGNLCLVTQHFSLDKIAFMIKMLNTCIVNLLSDQDNKIES